MPEISVKEAIDALAQHAATTRNPSILAALKHIEAGMDGQHEQRPMDRHDSPGMRAARQHTRPEYHNGGPKKQDTQKDEAKADQAPSPGKQAAQRAPATNGASSE
jgi:hypothetical protein